MRPITRRSTSFSLLLGAVSVSLALLNGCGGGGGGGSSEPAAPAPGSQPVVSSLRFGNPVLEPNPGGVDGLTISGNSGTVDLVAPSRQEQLDGARVVVWMQVNISGPAISYFEWEITSWAQTDPTIAGTLSGYDEELGYDIDYVRRRFMVRTRSPQLKYKSSGVLHTITSPFTETIRVTAVAANGYTTGAFFYVHALPRSEAGITAASALLQTAFPSNRRPGSYANYYQLTGSGDTTINMSSGVFDTYLALYNANHALIQTNDDISGADQNSRIRVTLQRGQTYIVEATSYAQSKTGEFALSVTGGSLSAATSPWTSDGGCAQVSGRYDVSQTIQYTGDVNETVPVQYVADIAATGCSFVGSATGDIGLEFGEVDSIDGAANTVTIRSFSLIITNPNLQIRISNFGGSGTITASGGVIRRMAVNEAFNMFMTMNGNSASVHVVTSAVFIRR